MSTPLPASGSGASDAQGSKDALVASLPPLLRNYLLPMHPGKTVIEFIEASFNPESQAPRLTALIESNPFYADFLQKLDILSGKLKTWQEEKAADPTGPPITQKIVGLLGPAIVRDAIIAIWMSRHAPPGLPRKNGGKPVMIAPRTQLRFASTIARYFEENNLAHGDVAYMAAVCFDWISAVIVKGEKSYLDNTWNEAMPTARIAYELASIPKNLHLSAHAYSSTLLIHLGRVLMAASFPKTDSTGGWKDFLRSCDQHHVPPGQLRALLESRKFAFTHAEVAAMCALMVPMLQPSHQAILYHHEPYLIRRLDRDSHALAAILSAAITLGTRKKIEDLSASQKADLTALGLHNAEIQSAMTRAFRKDG